MTPAQKRHCERVKRLSKGWPVGISTPKAMAERLVNLGYAEWAPPAWIPRKPTFSIRLTIKGEVAIQ